MIAKSIDGNRVIFKTRAAVFLRNFLNTTRHSRVVLDPIKLVLRVFLNGFKNVAEKACVKRVHNNYTFVDVGN